MAEKIRNGMRSFLRIEPAQGNIFYINESLDFESNIFKNRIWYRGDPDELIQFYKSVPGPSNQSRFWTAVPTTGREIRKIHTGLPSMIIDMLVNIVMSDLGEIEVTPEKYQAVWDSMGKENKFNKLLGDAITNALVSGDGAFKLSINTDLSDYPILEFIPGEFCEFQYERGRLKEITFKTIYRDGRENNKEYILYESYGHGYISSELRLDGKVVPIGSIPQTKGISETVTFDKSFMMAVPLMFIKSNKWQGRGRSIIDNKSDAFDAFDECWSQWMDAVRQGRATKYIPSNMIPRNPSNGEMLAPNAFDNSYIQHEQPMTETTNPKIEVIQPDIPTENYIQTYITALDQCLQGIISPSTLGIDTKKLDNAEAQREKEKTTLYTRNKIIDELQEMLPVLIDTSIKTYLTLQKQSLEDTKADITFGEYANPSFESQVETVSKGKQGGIMSIEAAVDELYGDTRDKEWKAEEVKRLKEEQGIMETEEVSIGDDDILGSLPDASMDSSGGAAT